MEAGERAQMRAEILDEVGAILRERFAANEWGRALVTVARIQGSWHVAEIDVEEIVGDEALVDAACGSYGAREVLPVLAHAVEALAAIDDMDLEKTSGATFVRKPNGGFAFLGGLVRTPSGVFDQARDGAVAWLRESIARISELGVIDEATRIAFDEQSHKLTVGAAGAAGFSASATVIGSYADEARTWAWGGTNPSLSPAARARSAKLTDDILERDAWEISTPHFATDAGTARALAAWVAKLSGADALLEAPHPGGAVYFALFGVSFGA